MNKPMQNHLGPGLSLREAMHLQELEGNPFDAEDIALFEMFEREGWSEEKCIAYILQRTLTEGRITD